DDVRLLRRGIRCIGRQTTPDGLTYGHAPTIAHHCILPDFTLIWMISLWDDYWQSGSLETFMDAEIQDILQKALAYFEHHSDPHTGLVRYDPRHWLFLDWAPLKKEGHPAILSFWLLYTLDKLATLYTLSEDSERATRLKQWAGRLRLALGNLLDPMDGLYVDGTDDNGLPYAGNKSVHTQTLACLCGVADSDQTKAHLIEGSLLPFVRGEDCPLVKPSVYWCTYVFSVLDLAGYGEDVVRYIRRHWAQMADHGTTWSQMKGYGGEQSHSHAWSAHPLYHLMQIVGGIRQTAPAWRRIEFRPLLWDRSAEITIPTPQGQIEAHWSKSSENEAQVSLHLPAGIEAKVILPGLEPLSVGAGLWQWSVPAGDQPSFLEPQLLSHPPISTSIHS
ncbi:MAG: alpha-L-rhamnosidase C-terminal domain-containing protein, partial [Puniceicoccales bacterium]